MTHGPKLKTPPTGHRVVRKRSDHARAKHYDPKPRRIEPEQTNRGGKGPAPKIHGRAETRRTEAERIEQVGNLGRAFDKAQGNAGAMLAVAEDAERLGFAELARRYRQAAG